MCQLKLPAGFRLTDVTGWEGCSNGSTEYQGYCRSYCSLKPGLRAACSPFERCEAVLSNPSVGVCVPSSQQTNFPNPFPDVNAPFPNFDFNVSFDQNSFNFGGQWGHNGGNPSNDPGPRTPRPDYNAAEPARPSMRQSSYTRRANNAVNSGQSSIGLIIGLSVGGFLLLVLIGLVFYRRYRSKNSTKVPPQLPASYPAYPQLPPTNLAAPSAPSYFNPPPSAPLPYELPPPTYAESQDFQSTSSDISFQLPVKKS